MHPAAQLAEFGVENEHMCDMHEAKLVVRALGDIGEGEEVLNRNQSTHKGGLLLYLLL
jgi:hypothetical protein